MKVLKRETVGRVGYRGEQGATTLDEHKRSGLKGAAFARNRANGFGEWRTGAACLAERPIGLTTNTAIDQMLETRAPHQKNLFVLNAPKEERIKINLPCKAGHIENTFQLASSREQKGWSE